MNLKILAIIICLSILVHASVAQQAKPLLQINANSVVRDSSGMRYPYAAWQKLLQSGDYSLRSKKEADQSISFLLVKLSKKDKELRMISAPRPRETPYFTTGEKLPPFSVKDMKGKKYKLKELVGKIVVMNFWFINCAPCRKEIPELNELVATYKDNPDVVFLAMALDEAYEVDPFLKSNPFNYNIVPDEKYLAAQYGIKAYPTHVIANREGSVIFHTYGYAVNTVYWLDKSIKEALEKK